MGFDGSIGHTCLRFVLVYLNTGLISVPILHGDPDHLTAVPELRDHDKRSIVGYRLEPVKQDSASVEGSYGGEHVPATLPRSTRPPPDPAELVHRTGYSSPAGSSGSRLNDVTTTPDSNSTGQHDGR